MKTGRGVVKILRKDIAAKIERSKETQYLDLADMAIGGFQGFPDEMPDLQELHLERNYFRSLAGMPKMPKLQRLDLSFNQLQSLAGCPTHFPILNEMNLSHNLIEGFESFPDTPWLKSLNLSFNQFRNLKGYPRCLRLKLNEINLESNPIETFAGLEPGDLGFLLLKLDISILKTFNLGSGEIMLIKDVMDYPMGPGLKKLHDFLQKIEFD